MIVDLKVVTVTQYALELDLRFDYTEREPEYWKKPANSKTISAKEADALQCILTCEASVYLLRRSTGVDGGNVDNMVAIRRFFINEYETAFAKKYVELNGDYY
jgi:hypothetical protein